MLNFAFSTFEVPGQAAGSFTSVGGINDLGQIAGTYGAGEGRVFVRTAGQYDTAPNVVGGVSGLNNLDLVAGSFASLDGGNVAIQQFDPFTKQFGSLQSFVDPFPNFPVSGGINDFGAVVGTSILVGPEGNAAATAFLEKDGTFTNIQLPPDLPAGGFTEATGINDFGQITGWYGNQVQNQGFIDTDGVFKTIAVPGAASTEPTAINNLGWVAGDFSAGGYSPTGGFLDIDGKFTTFAYPGAFETVVTGINDFGQIVGDYYDGPPGYGAGSFVATPVLASGDRIDLATLGLADLGLARTPSFLRPPTG